MTPFELEILLHMYCSPINPPAFDRRPPILVETVAAFVQENLVEEWPAEERSSKYCEYRLTQRGKAYIEHVLDVPLPVIKWVLPSVKDWPDYRHEFAANSFPKETK